MMNDYLNYISKSLTRIIFTEAKEKETIGIILGDTEGYKSLRDDFSSNSYQYLPVKWAKKIDKELAYFMLHMFAKTNQLNLKQVNIEQFKIEWDNYTNDPYFFVQVVNYMRNSDDYVYGDRYQLATENPHSQFRNSNQGKNMFDLFEGFKINKSSKELYYSKIIALGESLHRLLIEE